MAQLEQILYKVARGLYTGYSKFCNLDISWSLDDGNQSAVISGIGTKSDGPKSRTRPNSRKAFAILCDPFSFLVLIIFVYTVIHFSAITYTQYKYDIYATGLKNIQVGLSLTDINEKSFKSNRDGANKDVDALAKSQSSARHIELLEFKLNKTYWSLKQLGSPYTGFNFAFEASSVLMIVMAFLCYVVPQVMFYFDQSFDSFFIRMIFDEQLERGRCRQLIGKELELLQKSCIVFVDNVIELGVPREDRQKVSHVIDQLKEKSLRGQCLAMDMILRATTAGLRKQLIDQRALLELLYELRKVENEHMLWPMNRHPKRVFQMTLQYCILMFTQMIYSLVFDTLFIAVVPIYSQGLDLVNIKDYVTIVEAIILAQISAIPITFHAALFTPNCAEQSRYADKLRQDIIECMNANDSSYQVIVDMEQIEGSSDEIERISYEINSRLLLAILKYKIYIAQLKPVKESFTFLASCSMILMFVIPTIVRMHFPYLKEEFWAPAFYLSMIGALVADTINVPISTLHHQGQNLIRSMNFLLARSLELTERSKTLFRQDYGICNEHTIAILCKELEDYQISTNQFATHILGSFPLTISNLILVHYWFGLVIISAFVETESWRKLFGDRMNDPFGISTRQNARAD